MKNKIISNIIFSFSEKLILILSQFISGIIIIRNLERTDYGLLGIFAGYFVFLNLFNLSIESILIRDFKKYTVNLNLRLESFIQFNLIKSFLIFLLSIPITIHLFYSFNTVKIFYVFGISFALLVSQTLISPLITYFTVIFNQKKVTIFNSIKVITRLVFLMLLFFYPSLLVYFLVEFTVSTISFGVWFYIGKKELKISLFRILSFSKMNFEFVKKSIFSYSIWIHLNGVITAIIYKSDPFFLALDSNEKEIGDYNVALNSSNIANIIPSIFGYQNSIAISNSRNKTDIEKITSAFIKLSIYFGMITLFCFLTLGGFYLRILTGDDNIDNMFFYQSCIVLGLVISKTFASPLVSIINILGDVRTFFFNVSLPIFFVTILSYTFTSIFYKSSGIAMANIFNSIIWLVLIINQIKKMKYKLRLKFNLKSDLKLIKLILKS